MSVTLAGADLAGFPVTQPASSVRILLPDSGSGALEMPEWNGNEFLRPDGGRPVIRTVTPRRFDTATPALDVEIVLHEGGALSAWASAARAGMPVAVSGPGRGYDVDPSAPGFLIAGDESALPAISQLLEVLPDAPVTVHIEVAHPDARVDMPAHPQAALHWHDRNTGDTPGHTLTTAVRASSITAGTRVWVAGEAAAVQRIRKHLFDERAVPRADAWVRGYWKQGRAGDTTGD